MRCPNCGNENPPDYVFCDECGARLQDLEGTELAPDAGVAADAGSSPTASTESDQLSSAQVDTGASADDTSMDQESAAADEQWQPSMELDTGTTASQISAPIADTDVEGAPAQMEQEEQTDRATADAGAAAGAPADVDLEQALETPLTEDTAAPATADSSQVFASDTAAEEQTPMPDVTPIPEEAPVAAGAGASAATGAAMAGSYSDISPAASGTPATAAAETGDAWASSALDRLDEAQQALAGGDWLRFGQAMSALRSHLESASQGAAMPQSGARTSTSYISAEQAQAGDMEATGTGAPSYQAGGAAPTLEPEAEAGTLGTGVAPAPTPISAQDMSALGAAPVPGTDRAGQPTTMARLVVISTGAELPLPDQEEITVGREDPSSGIFPDVDLTPYGGEEGGVSRRHARMLYIDGEYYVEDLQSTNYTKIDGQRLPAHIREKVEDGARIDFGRVAVIFRRS